MHFLLFTQGFLPFPRQISEFLANGKLNSLPAKISLSDLVKNFVVW